MDIAIIIQNILQYYSLRPFLQFVEKEKCWKNDIYVLDPKETTTGFSDIMEELKCAILRDGFRIANEKSQNKKYKICLAPYQNMIDIKSDYLINYYYGALSAKPFTFDPELKSKFDGFLLHSNYDANILSLYGKTHIVPRLPLREVKLKKHTGKKRLLYLPTYGKESSIETVIKVLPAIKDEYEILVKGHHGTSHLKNEVERMASLKDVADHYYTPTKDLQELFEEADVVLSDNSGAIFDALYANVPVCILSKNIDNSFANISPLQKKLVDDKVIPYSSEASANELLRILHEALSKKTIKIQRQKSDLLFPNKNGGAKEWVKVLKDYMDDNVDMDYMSLHRYYLEKQTLLKQELSSARAEFSDTISNLNSKLYPYENGKLYKIVTKIYKIKNKK